MNAVIRSIADFLMASMYAKSRSVSLEATAWGEWLPPKLVVASPPYAGQGPPLEERMAPQKTCKIKKF
jgi:hypothetical protein